MVAPTRAAETEFDHMPSPAEASPPPPVDSASADANSTTNCLPPVAPRTAAPSSNTLPWFVRGAELLEANFPSNMSNKVTGVTPQVSASSLYPSFKQKSGQGPNEQQASQNHELIQTKMSTPSQPLGARATSIYTLDGFQYSQCSAATIKDVLTSHPLPQKSVPPLSRLNEQATSTADGEVPQPTNIMSSCPSPPAALSQSRPEAIKTAPLNTSRTSSSARSDDPLKSSINAEKSNYSSHQASTPLPVPTRGPSLPLDVSKSGQNQSSSYHSARDALKPQYQTNPAPHVSSHQYSLSQQDHHNHQQSIVQKHNRPYQRQAAHSLPVQPSSEPVTRPTTPNGSTIPLPATRETAWACALERGSLVNTHRLARLAAYHEDWAEYLRAEGGNDEAWWLYRRMKGFDGFKTSGWHSVYEERYRQLDEASADLQKRQMESVANLPRSTTSRIQPPIMFLRVERPVTGTKTPKLSSVIEGTGSLPNWNAYSPAATLKRKADD